MAQASEEFLAFTDMSDVKLDGRRLLFRSQNSRISASNSCDLHVDVKIDSIDEDTMRMLTELALRLGAGDSTDVANLMSSATANFSTMLEKVFSNEFDAAMAAYRSWLEMKMATGDDEAVSRAMTRAKLQTEILSSVDMVDQSGACTLLGLSDANPSATLKRYEAKDKILRFDVRGKASYPLFQFDVAERRIYPPLLSVMEMRTDNWGGKMALLHWLTRPNLSLEGHRPCDVISEREDAILRSFSAELSETMNG